MRYRMSVASLFALLAFAVPLSAQEKDLTYNTVTPCVFVDTRLAGGLFAAGETRTYSVTGSGSFAGQGGSASGCGVPAFSNGVARVQAVAINIIAIGPAGAGHLNAFAADAAATASFLNFVPAQNVANTGPVAVAQTSGVGDLKIQAVGSGTHIQASVVGYYTRFGETITVGPGATDAASGTALRDALSSIADNSASKPYLIKLEPGIYDLGDTTLTMKPYVDIEGSGEGVTTITANDATDRGTGTIAGASNTELRDLTVVNTGGGSYAKAIEYQVISAARITRVTAIASGGTDSNAGARHNNCTDCVLTDVTLRGTGGGSFAVGLILNTSERFAVRRTNAAGTNGATSYGIWLVNNSGVTSGQLEDLTVTASGGGTSYGVKAGGGPGTLNFELRNSKITARDATGTNYGLHAQPAGFVPTTVENSTITASGGAASQGVNASNLRIDHSRITGANFAVNSAGGALIGSSYLSGGPIVGATCAGVYDETYTFFAAVCP